MPLQNLNIPIQTMFNNNDIHSFMNNESFIHDFNNPINTPPLLQQNIMLNNIPQQRMPIQFTEENINTLKRFNVNATRSNSSSSSNSSGTNNSRMSNGTNVGSLLSNSMSPSINILDFDYNYDLSSSVKNRNKLFEDDVIFCPRSLLSQSELKTREELDKFLINRYNDYMLHQQQPHLIQNIDDNRFQNMPKFNPYASKSFTPSN